jgi:hypothetical protein
MNGQVDPSIPRRRLLRRRFLAELAVELRIIWPILSGLVLLIVLVGTVIGLIEGWSLGDSVYFSFVTGLTIGYGDLVPKAMLSRALAAVLGMMGILVTALVAAVAVTALGRVSRGDER